MPGCLNETLTFSWNFDCTTVTPSTFGGNPPPAADERTRQKSAIARARTTILPTGRYQPLQEGALVAKHDREGAVFEPQDPDANNADEMAAPLCPVAGYVRRRPNRSLLGPSVNCVHPTANPSSRFFTKQLHSIKDTAKPAATHSASRVRKSLPRTKVTTEPPNPISRPHERSKPTNPPWPRDLKTQPP